MAPPPSPGEAEVAVSVNIVPGKDIFGSEAKGDAGIPVMVELKPPEGTARTPLDICCIVDISGSMGAEALIQTETGGQAGHGLSVLDLVKHALKTIAKNLDDSDRLALVSYSNTAEVVLHLTETRSMDKIEGMMPSGQTNLWAGLLKGLEELKQNGETGRLQHIMLFTDGLPNLNPPRGIIPMAERFKSSQAKSFHGGVIPTINTFGFGYELDSELLSDLANVGSGAYAFIPDGGFVGTVFVNAVTNLMVTMAKDVELVLEPMNGATLVGDKIFGGHPFKKTADGSAYALNMGTLQFGQASQAVVQMKLPPEAAEKGYLKATVKYSHRGTDKDLSLTSQVSDRGVSPNPELVERERLRLLVVDGIRECMNIVKLTAADKLAEKPMDLDAAKKRVTELSAAIDASLAKDQLQGLKEDLEGQVREALSKPEWYKKWGVHYFPSLMFAHLKQQCNNFKDAGVQAYGGELFQRLRQVADKIFIELPPPTATAVPVVSPGVTAAPDQSRYHVAPMSSPIASMSAYYSSSGG